MRRFSQRNSLVTLSDINITPLLDLAFVLLIIFVITTPLLEQSIQLTLPTGGKADKSMLRKEDIKVLEISTKGTFRLAGKDLPLKQIETELVKLHRSNQNLVVQIRTDEEGRTKYFVSVLDMLQRNGIKIHIATRTER